MPAELMGIGWFDGFEFLPLSGINTFLNNVVNLSDKRAKNE
jgi:hypothetical protein